MTEIVNGREVAEFDAVKVAEVEAAVNYETLASCAASPSPSQASPSAGSGRALRPVHEISRTAAEIQATDLSERIHLKGPKDELRDLAETVDSMLDRLDEAFRAQRQLIDDASHELRSPLADIRANLDAVLLAEESDDEDRRSAARGVDRATTRMTRLVEGLLATARRNAPALADADLAAAADEACEEFAPLAADRGLTLRRRLSPGLTVIGDHDALRRAGVRG
ncbi:sensor histidine kinase [Streptomyces cyaneochromogenes]|uniref:sensor histidine kinase n=1 Tax=Streptomyces cyaneochromogenes TaxID=2496836 RepID=UPI001E2B23AF|nr:HAMP domain-containing protein [Streptomyces cyaneochromogenes]